MMVLMNFAASQCRCSLRSESKLVAKGDGWSWMTVALLISRSIVAWKVVLTIAVVEWL